jgi:hypothetical protein
MLKMFKTKDVNGPKTPMPTTNPHVKAVDQKIYRYMIGFLLYLCSSRLDIMLSVGICAKYQVASKEILLLVDVKKNISVFCSYPKLRSRVPQGCKLLSYWILGFGLGERKNG